MIACNHPIQNLHADHSGQISVFIQNTFCLFFISSPIYHNDSPYFVLPVEFFAAQGNKHQFRVADAELVHGLQLNWVEHKLIVHIEQLFRAARLRKIHITTRIIHNNRMRAAETVLSPRMQTSISEERPTKLRP